MKKRILIFCPYYSVHVGGLESFVKDLNEELLKNISGLEIVVLTSLIPNSQKNIEVNGRLKIVRLPFFEIINNFPVPKFWSKLFWKSYKQVTLNDYDLVITHTRFFLTSLMVCFFSRKQKIKWIHFEHGSDFVRAGNLFVRVAAKVYDFLIGRLVLKSADEVVSISEAVKQFVKLLSGRESEVFYRGFDFEKIMAVRKDVSIEQKYRNYFKIIFVGRLISGKGVIDLVTALSKMVVSKKWICLVVGDGNCKKSLIDAVKKNKLENKVVFLGSLNHEKTLSVLKTCDLLVNPSYTEGLPTTVLEAVTLGKPVLATDVGGTKECFYKKVDLLEPGNREMFVKMLGNFVDNGKLNYSLDKNKNYIVEKFDWNKIVKKFNDWLN